MDMSHDILDLSFIQTGTKFNNYNSAGTTSNLYVNNILIPPFVYSLNQYIEASGNIGSLGNYIYNPSQLIYEQFINDFSNNTTDRFTSTNPNYPLNTLTYSTKSVVLPNSFHFPDVSYNGIPQTISGTSYNFGNFWYYPFIAGDTIVFYMNLVPSPQQTIFTLNNTTRVVKFILKCV
jgi:hypothetical protein